MRQTEDSLLCLPIRKAKLYIRRWWVWPLIISEEMTEPQNCRRWQGLQRSQAGPLWAGCPRLCLGFEYFQGWWLQNLSGQLVPVFHHPQSRNVFPEVHVYVMEAQRSPVGSSTILFKKKKKSPRGTAGFREMQPEVGLKLPRSPR